jgi:sugar phosphate isomerase/epimerase
MIHGHLKDLGIKYDPSHCYQEGGDYMSETKNWGDRFFHVHIKGCINIDGKRFDNVPAGLDQLDWGSFLALLYIKNYKGLFSIEAESNLWVGEMREIGIDYTIEYLKKLLILG